MLLRVLVPLILGIITGYYIDNILSIRDIFIAQTFVFLVMLLFANYKIGVYSFKILLFIIFLFAGLWRVYLVHPNDQSQYFSKFPSPYLLAKLLDEPKVTAERIQYILTIQGQGDRQLITAATGKLSVTIYAPQNAPLQYGDLLLLKANYQAFTKPLNPGAFDNRRFMSSKAVYFQQHGDEGTIILLGKDHGSAVYRASYILRDQLLIKFGKYLGAGFSYQFLSAIILGYRENFEADNYGIFTDTGTVHLLAISGMHVGILFKIVQLILQFIPIVNNWKYLQLLMLFAIVWVYIFCTGLPPSAVRAGIMVSYILLTRTYGIYKISFNTIWVSAIISLVIMPMHIYSLGFQFSYLAVLGIFIFQELAAFRGFKGRPLLRYFVLCIGISFSAQVVCTPLSLYIFGTFPSYFLLGNIWSIIPIHILMFGGLLLAIGFPSLVNEIVASAILFTVDWIKLGLTKITTLPYAVFHVYSIDGLQLLGIYSFLFSMLAWMLWRKLRYLVLSILTLIGLIGYLHQQRARANKLAALTIYAIRSHLVFSIYQKQQLSLYSDLSTLTHPSHQYSVYPHLRVYGDLQAMEFTPLTEVTNYDLRASSARILVIQSPLYCSSGAVFDSYRRANILLIKGLPLADILLILSRIYSPQIGVMGTFSAAERALIAAIAPKGVEVMIFPAGSQSYRFPIVL